MSVSRKNVIQATLVSCFGLALLFLIAPPQVRTYPPFLAKAKSMGLPAKDCTYCHVNATGGEPFNARGSWLVAEKGKRGASAVDVGWLKDYKKGGGAKAGKSRRARH